MEPENYEQSSDWTDAALGLLGVIAVVAVGVGICLVLGPSLDAFQTSALYAIAYRLFTM